MNLFVFLLALQASIQIKATICDYGNLRTMLWLSIVLLPLLAALWILGLLSINDAIDELHYAYSLTTLLSSLYVFIGYCLVNRRVRHNINLNWQTLTGNGGNVHGSNESFSATRTSVTSRGAGGGVTTALYHGSNFDVYGMHSTGMPIDATLGGAVISSSSTTSRSTMTKGSVNGLADIENVMDDTDQSKHRGRRHRHHKCRRRHRHHRHHCSKQSVASETGSSDDASYDRSMELASSHSSDDEDDTPGKMDTELIRSTKPEEQLSKELLQRQQENQINAMLQEHHQQQQQALYGANPIAQQTSSDGGVSSGANTVIYGQRVPFTGGTPAIIKQTNQTHLVTSMPFSRSNILAMTAGLSDVSQPSPQSKSPVYGHHQPSPPPPAPEAPPPLSEHIYAYARKPHQQNSPVHYSTIGGKSSIVDDIGLPPISTSTYRPHYQGFRENPYASANIATTSAPVSKTETGTSHVRLLSAFPATNTPATEQQTETGETSSGSLNSDSRTILTAPHDSSTR